MDDTVRANQQADLIDLLVRFRNITERSRYLIATANDSDRNLIIPVNIRILEQFRSRLPTYQYLFVGTEYLNLLEVLDVIISDIDNDENDNNQYLDEAMRRLGIYIETIISRSGPRAAMFRARYLTSAPTLTTSAPPLHYSTPPLPIIYKYTSNKECIICLSEFEDGDELRQLRCHPSHVFHVNCINRVSTCPLCRKDLSFGRKRNHKISKTKIKTRVLGKISKLKRH